MPPSGFKSVTLTKETYDHFEKIYRNKKKILAKSGITNFSGFVTKLLNDGGNYNDYD